VSDNIIIRMLDPEQYYLLEDFCESEGIPMLNPEWSKVVAAIDMDTEKVIGIVVSQMQLHTEPIWVSREYQGNGLVDKMTDAMEGYLDFLAGASGVDIGVYNQPTNAAAERICRRKGYTKSDKPLYVKIYKGDRVTKEDQ
jgi:ribosomal protein S18 acetylase RimI-like enzyme